MSFCTLHRDVTRNAVALCGLYEGPLDTYLRENPQIKYIFLCLDADGPGKEAAERMKDKYAQKGYVVSFSGRPSPCAGPHWPEEEQTAQPPQGQAAFSSEPAWGWAGLDGILTVKGQGRGCGKK